MTFLGKMADTSNIAMMESKFEEKLVMELAIGVDIPFHSYCLT